MTRCHKESFESTEGQTRLPPPPFSEPFLDRFEIWTKNNIFLSLSFSTFIRALQRHVTGEWRKGQEQSEFDLPTRPRSREIQKSIHRFMITIHQNTTTPK